MGMFVCVFCVVRCTYICKVARLRASTNHTLLFDGVQTQIDTHTVRMFCQTENVLWRALNACETLHTLLASHFLINICRFECSWFCWGPMQQSFRWVAMVCNLVFVYVDIAKSLCHTQMTRLLQT